MHSSLIGKVEKANRYARELDRITIDRLSLTFRGDNDTHHVGLDAGQWRCTCHYFESWGSCVHLLTLQKVFGVMLPEEAQVSIFAAEPVDRLIGPAALGPLSAARRRPLPGPRRSRAGRPPPVRAAVVDGQRDRAVVGRPGDRQSLTRRHRARTRSPSVVPSGGSIEAIDEPSPASQPAVSRTTTGAP